MQELIQNTLDNKLVKENPVPKEIILEEPKKGGAADKKEEKKAAPAAEEAPKDKKKAKVKNVEVIQLEPSQEILEVAAHVYTQLEHPQAYIQQLNDMLREPMPKQVTPPPSEPQPEGEEGEAKEQPKEPEPVVPVTNYV